MAIPSVNFFLFLFHVSGNNKTGGTINGFHVQHIQHVQHVQHVEQDHQDGQAKIQHVQHVKHEQQDGQAKDTDDSNKYNNKSGDEVPIKIYISSSLILSLIIYMLLLQYGISPNPGP